MADRVVSVAGAAQILGKSEATVRAWTRSGKLRAIVVPGTGQRIFDVEHLEEVAQGINRR